MGIFENKVRKYNERMKKDLQLEDVHTCGIWGNLGVETGGFTALQEKNPTVKGSRGGFGWLQWTGPRRKKYEAWAKAKGLDISDDETNYLYFVHETLTDEWKSVQQVRKTTTIDAATETFMLLNLRPGVQHLDARKRWAKKAADALSGSAARDQGSLKMKTGTKVAIGTGATTGAVIAAGSAATYVPTNYLPHVAAVLVGLAVIGAVIYILKGK